jgi:hypothetical protein
MIYFKRLIILDKFRGLSLKIILRSGFIDMSGYYTINNGT